MVKTNAPNDAANAPPQPSKHRYRMPSADEVQPPDPPDPKKLRTEIEPWLSAMFQAEHLALLVGNGLTMGASYAAAATPVSMAPVTFPPSYHAKILAAAERSAVRTGRGKANLEDQLRSANELRQGFVVQDEAAAAAAVHTALTKALHGLLRDVLKTERAIRAAYDASPDTDVLGSFLLSFASRSASRERLHLFTTNYDRLIEFAAERLGLRVLDRFVGSLEPRFRSSRLEIDLHYNPPGIRGEPRYLEGVIKLAKLHGSIDWRFDDGVRRVMLPFGADETHPEAAETRVGDAGVIYPMAAKDVEVSAFPYSELFRDFSAAICRPNSILVTYGYGFGDTHINAAIRDMLTIPSTHIVIISYDEADGRVGRFIAEAKHGAQVSYLLGPHFGDLGTLVDHYLPKPAIDRITARHGAILQARGGFRRPEVESQDEDL
jgi:hypothetical protein